MSVSNEISISPALLQAISTLTSAKDGAKVATKLKMNPQLNIKQEIMDSVSTDDSIVHHQQDSLYDGGGERVNSLLNNTENDPDSNILQTSQEEEEQGSSQDSPTISPEDIKNMLKWKISKSINQSVDKGENLVSEHDMRMVNVLTSLAMQQVKSNMVNASQTGTAHMDAEERMGGNSSVTNGQQVLINYNNENVGPPSPPAQDVSVSDANTIIIDSNGQRFILGPDGSEGLLGQR